MNEAFSREVTGQLASILARLDAFDSDLRELLRKLEALEAARHEHSKRFLRAQHDPHSPARRHPVAAVGGGVAAGGALGLLIERLITFFLGM